MRSTFNFFNLAAISALTVLLVGCASAPRAEVDAAKIRSVHTVTVVYPGKAVYSAGRPQFGFQSVGGGAIVAIATGTAAAVANAHNAKQNPLAFDDVVTKKLGDTQLNRKFTDGIEAALRSHGYVVREVDASDPALPMFARDTHEAVLRQRIYSVKLNDPYNYYSTDLIEADLAHAISGLDESMMAQVGVFDRSLDGIAH
jgi:hypothetical protein